MNTCYKLAILLQIAIFSLFNNQAEAQCVDATDGYPDRSEAQLFEHPDVDPTRTLVQCMDWVQTNVPHAVALYYDAQGSCIAYVAFDGLSAIGNVGSSFCQFEAGTMPEAFGPDCKKAVFNGLFKAKKSTKTNLGFTDTMKECMDAGEGLHAVQWLTEGKCFGYTLTTPYALFQGPTSTSMVSYSCVLDEAMV